MDVWAPMWLILATFWPHFPGFNHFLATFEGIILIFSLHFVFHHLAIFSVILFMLNMLINSLSMIGRSHATWSNTRLVPLCQVSKHTFNMSDNEAVNCCSYPSELLSPMDSLAAVPDLSFHQDRCHYCLHLIQFITLLQVYVSLPLLIKLVQSNNLVHESFKIESPFG